MIGAFLHTWLSKWILRVPSENFSTLPLFSVGDIPFWFVFRTEWVKYLRKLSLLKKKLTRRHWHGLGVVYPRIGVFAYCFYLFQWPEYCDQTEDLITHSDDYILRKSS